MSLTRQETVFEMLAARLPASALDAFDAPATVSTDVRNTRPELGPSKSWASQGDHKRGPTTFRDGRALPSWVEAEEARTGERFFFVEQGDFHGWAKAAPPKYPELLEREKRTGEKWSYDYSRGMYRPHADMFSPMPPAMAETCERHGIEKGDPRYPILNEQTGHWSWGELYANRGLGYGEPVQRPDLNGLDYWQDQARYGVVRPGGSVEKYGAQVEDGAGSLHNPENSIPAEPVKGGAA